MSFDPTHINRYRYYTCSTKARQGETGCVGRSVPMEKLDTFVAGHIEKTSLGVPLFSRRPPRESEWNLRTLSTHRSITVPTKVNAASGSCIKREKKHNLSLKLVSDRIAFRSSVTLRLAIVVCGPHIWFPLIYSF
jgi:hypothetical protein